MGAISGRDSFEALQMGADCREQSMAHGLIIGIGPWLLLSDVLIPRNWNHIDLDKNVRSWSFYIQSKWHWILSRKQTSSMIVKLTYLV